MRAGSLFSGIGGLDLGLHRAGFEHAFFCEADPYRREVLARHWPGVPIYEDVREIDSTAPAVDLVCGGFPCQPFSVAGKRGGADDERFLWPEFLRILSHLRPEWVLIENVPGLLTDYTTTEPADRCVCGWTDRRGGLSLHRQDAMPGAASRNGSERSSAPDDASRPLRREPVEVPRGDGEVAGGMDVDAERSEEGKREFYERANRGDFDKDYEF